MGWIRKILIYVIRLYQKYISPLKGRKSCRFYPTCSQYAIDALGKYGVVKGCMLSLRRLLKCHPFHPGGYDPVNQEKIVEGK